MERKLTPAEAGSAVQLQHAIDDMGRRGGGRLILPEIELILDRGLALRSGVELIGQGEETLLRKGPGRIYPLAGYHNYGMCDVPLVSTAGLEVGMTVSIHDNRTHGGFYETFAAITWIQGDWVGLDHGIEADYLAGEAPCLTTVYPLIFGHGVRQVAVRDLRLEGNRLQNEKSMGGCRGGAVYFANSRDLELSGVRERDYFGEGLSFQMCREVRIVDCQFDENSGNGLHPGAGSTNALFERCGGAGNGKSGFFFCVRANRITVRDCQFRGNANGMSIGTRDCHNLIDGCVIEKNRGPGILVRETPRPTQVHSCLIRDCRILANAGYVGQGQVEIAAEAQALIFERNHFAEGGDRPGLFVAAGTTDIYLEQNRFTACDQEVKAAPGSLTDKRPRIEWGYGEWPEENFKHLDSA